MPGYILGFCQMLTDVRRRDVGQHVRKHFYIKYIDNISAHLQIGMVMLKMLQGVFKAPEIIFHMWVKLKLFVFIFLKHTEYAR